MLVSINEKKTWACFNTLITEIQIIKPARKRFRSQVPTEACFVFSHFSHYSTGVPQGNTVQALHALHYWWRRRFQSSGQNWWSVAMFSIIHGLAGNCVLCLLNREVSRSREECPLISASQLRKMVTYALNYWQDSTMGSIKMWCEEKSEKEWKKLAWLWKHFSRHHCLQFMQVGQHDKNQSLNLTFARQIYSFLLFTFFWNFVKSGFFSPLLMVNLEFIFSCLNKTLKLTFFVEINQI